MTQLDWMRQTEVADYLHITTRQVNRLMARGDLQAYRVGGARRPVLFRRADVEALLVPVARDGE